MKEHIPISPLDGKILPNTVPHNHEFKELEWNIKQQDVSIVHDRLGDFAKM